MRGVTIPRLRDAACEFEVDAFVRTRHKGDTVCPARCGTSQRSGGAAAAEKQVLTADEG